MSTVGRLGIDIDAALPVLRDAETGVIAQVHDQPVARDAGAASRRRRIRVAARRGHNIVGLTGKCSRWVSVRRDSCEPSEIGRELAARQ
jgi:hypothetical protein